MPVYESTKNADNKIVISAANRDSVVFGWDKVLTALANKGAKTIAIDGWYGINYAKIAAALAAKIGKDVELIDACDLFLSREEVIAYNQPYVTKAKHVTYFIVRQKRNKFYIIKILFTNLLFQYLFANTVTNYNKLNLFIFSEFFGYVYK